jgi:hypothetical protein
MIDQKPVQPGYLELVSLKNFSSKEMEAHRKQTKESRDTKDNSSEQNQMGIYWCKQLSTELSDKFTI